MSEINVSFFPREMKVEITLDDAQDYIGDNFDDFFRWMVLHCEYNIAQYIDERKGSFAEWRFERR